MRIASQSASAPSPVGDSSDPTTAVDLDLTGTAPAGDPQAGTSPGPRTVPPSATVELLDPQTIEATEPNRLTDAFESESFQDLVDSVLNARGNTVPIIVRVLRPDEQQPGSQVKYRLIAGARRLKACALSKLPVRAIVQSASTQAHTAIDRLLENHLREPLSPYELGKQLLHIQALESPPSKSA